MSAEGPFKIDFPGARLYKSITYVRTLTGADIRKLAAAFRTDALMKIYEIFGSTLEGVSYKKLTVSDWWYLLIWQRLNSYPYFPMEVEWRCPECSSKNNTKLSKDSFVVEPLPDDYDHDNGVPVSFSGVGRALRLRLQTVDDDIAAHQYFATLGNTNPSADELEPVLMAYMICDKDLVLSEKISIIENKFSAEDYFKFKAFEQLYSYGVKDTVDLTCNKCNEKSEIPHRFNITQFFPGNLNRNNLRDFVSARAGSQPADRSSGTNGHIENDLDSSKVQRDTGSGREKERENAPKSTEKVEEVSVDFSSI